MKYLIILERTPTGYSAYSPDLDGCVAAAETRDKTVALMREAKPLAARGRSTVIALAHPKEEATHAMCHAYDGYTTNVALEEAPYGGAERRTVGLAGLLDGIALIAEPARQAEHQQPERDIQNHRADRRCRIE